MSEYDSLPGVDGHLLMPWWRHSWIGKCARHLRPMPKRVWSPVTCEEGDYCREILARDPCAYCGGPVEVIDHIEPSAKGGANDITNLTGACTACNQAKAAKPLILFLVTRNDPDERAHQRLERAEVGYRRALAVSIGDYGAIAWRRGVADAKLDLDAARALVERQQRWATP